MAADLELFLDRWHRIVAEQDVDSLGDVLCDDVTLGSPPYWPRLEGSEVVRHLLGIVIRTIENFTYQREWRKGSELALEFTGHVGEIELQGVDLISLDESGRVRNLDVVMRPLNAISALQKVIAPQMASFLQGRQSA